MGSFPTNRDGRPKPQPFLGRYQWCSAQGQAVSQCLVFGQQHPNMQPPSCPDNQWQSRSLTPGNQWQPRSPTPWRPQAYVATADTSTNSN